HGYYGYVNGKDGSGNNNYNYAASVLLPWAVKSCAGFLRFFYEEANRGRQESYSSGRLWSRGDTYTKYVDVPWGYHTVVLAGNEPDADFDLYVKWGAPPTTTSWDARGFSSDSLEHVAVKGNGRLYYMVRAFSGSGRWKANVVYGSPRNDAVIDPGRLSWYSGLETGGSLSGKDDAEWSASFGDSRNGMMHAWVYLAGPDSADFDLYIRWGYFATKSTYDDIGYSWRSQEICDAYRMGSDAYLFVLSHSYRGSGNYRLLILIF
ncbi:MAG: hypothetical protein JSW05_04320, partial [Candidatus Thorarchaeota archaeon]